MLRVFGNPQNNERTEQNNKNIQRTPVNSESEQENVQLQLVGHYKQFVQIYQKKFEQRVVLLCEIDINKLQGY